MIEVKRVCGVDLIIVDGVPKNAVLMLGKMPILLEIEEEGPHDGDSSDEGA